MSIKIIEDQEVTVTRADYERYKAEYQRLCLWHAPWRTDSLENYIRQQQSDAGVVVTAVQPPIE
jgi:hypothetical protein